MSKSEENWIKIIFKISRNGLKSIITENFVKFCQNWVKKTQEAKLKYEKNSLKIIKNWMKNGIILVNSEESWSKTTKKCWKIGENWP